MIHFPFEKKEVKSRAKRTRMKTQEEEKKLKKEEYSESDQKHQKKKKRKDRGDRDEQPEYVDDGTSKKRKHAKLEDSSTNESEFGDFLIQQMLTSKLATLDMKKKKKTLCLKESNI